MAAAMAAAAACARGEGGGFTWVSEISRIARVNSQMAADAAHEKTRKAQPTLSWLMSGAPSVWPRKWASSVSKSTAKSSSTIW